jgi:outer membrane protein OmpA-like peptidoglycan-associated protein
MKKFIAAMLISVLAVPAALADVATERDKTRKGAVIGGVAGAIAGTIIGNNKRLGGKGSAKRGAVVGTVAGTAAGAIVGAMMDRQERQLRQIEGVEVARTGDNELKVTMRNEVLFDFNSAGLRSASRDELREMADVFSQYNDTTIVVAGHTDSVGSSSYNQSLSERRAYAVSNYLEDLGVRGSRLDSVGYGESRPKSDNDTSSGRQRNRRVELYVRANS